MHLLLLEGEHIDYSLFGVFPAAIENDLLIAVAANSQSNGKISLDNVDPQYTKVVITDGKDSDGKWDLSINPAALRWESYVKAGYLVSYSSYGES